MACETGTWASVVPNNATEKDDGTIFIDRVHGTGEIEGRHRKQHPKPGENPEPLKMGHCENDHIKFDRTGFHYEGDILGRIIVGKRKDSRRSEIDDGEVWVGVKTA